MEIGLGLIGTGFMGKAHALAYRSARAVFGNVPKVRLARLCDADPERARALSEQFGFDGATSDWRAVIDDPRVDLVSVTTPNALHREIALAALAAGKHIHCEKPLALTLADAQEMAAAAEQAGVQTLVGYNYTHNPAFTHARRLVADGVIGRPVHFRGWVDEDYQADPDLVWTWRSRRSEAGLGALGDLGCHLVSMASALMGPIESLIADAQIVHATRPLSDGSGRAEVENEDTASAIVRFENGAHGSLCTSRTAWGRKNKLDWEVHGTHGMLAFSQERLNELQLYVNDGPASERGFRTILTGPGHPPYGAFCPAPGHQLGFNDLKVIEAAAMLRAIAGSERARPDFADALEFEAVIHAIDRSARDGRRVSPATLLSECMT